MVVGKKGWIRIVEALVAILLIIGFLVVIVDKGETREQISSKIYLTENSILKEIQIDYTFRDYILNVPNLPLEFENFDPALKSQIENRTPEYLTCTSRICDFDYACTYDGVSNKDIYGKSIMIAGNSDVYSPRQIRLFCWTE